MRRTILGWTLLGGLALLAACAEESTAPGPTPFALVLEIANDDDRAVALTLAAEIGGLEPAVGFRVFTHTIRDQTGIVVVPTGSASFPMGRVQVATVTFEDAAKGGTELTVRQVASDSLLRSADGYGARLEPRRR